MIEELADTPLLACRHRTARFFASLEAAGGNVVRTLSFADHHPYSQHDPQILEDAQRHGAEMITTQKDWMRSPADWRARVAMLTVTLEMDWPRICWRVETVIDSTTRRHGGSGGQDRPALGAAAADLAGGSRVVLALFLTARLLPITAAPSWAGCSA